MSSVLGFNDLNGQLQRLSDQKPSEVRSGHLNLAPSVWLSCDPRSKTFMSCTPLETGFRVEWEEADSGNWTCIGMSLPTDVVAKGRYVALRLDTETHEPIAFVACQRYYFQTQPMKDICAPNPVLLPSGRRVTFAHIPIDVDLIGRASGAELNLFLQSNTGKLPIKNLEILLMC